MSSPHKVSPSAMSNKRNFGDISNSSSSSRSSSSSISTASATPSSSSEIVIESLDHIRDVLFFNDGKKVLFKEVEIVDPKSSTGSRIAQLLAIEMCDTTGKKAIFEAWSADAFKAEAYFRLDA